MPARILYDGRESWDETVKGMIRWRGIVFGTFSSIIIPALLIFISTTGAPWWTDSLTWETAKDAIFNGAITSLAIGSICFFGLLYLRKRTIRSLNVKYLSHQVSHKVRDWHTRLNKNPDDVSLSGALNDICNTVQELFKELIPQKDIQVITRIISEKDGELYYTTVSRTGGLSPSRAKTSEPISANSGLARYLRERSGGKGAIICSDIDKSIQFNILTNTQNHITYPQEIKNLMAVGLNAWDGTDENMLGILFLTSKNINVFGPKHIDCLGGVADIIAGLVSSIIIKKGNISE
ncbi:hypothetical protein [Pseudoalteromonas sp. McH1-42]|uniref:hypothetical protein n=1 Tax=Pseudoalteromonas sp. McH1-42 TaxID=2917752 RepID=UPI001EF58B83|nr:hypothetical protein [Pseudoalteromonas sp. McH1-42]MCG7561470.1 hypothetical protein [Pseudoalteromonas sp. McH1-42]